MRAGISRKMLKSNNTAIKASAQNPLEKDVLAGSDFFTPPLRVISDRRGRECRRSRALAKADAVGGMIQK